MNFPELCDRLIGAVGRAPVYDPRYPSLGAKSIGAAGWVILLRGGRFDVGEEEKGDFIVSETFDTETEAYEHVFQEVVAAYSPVPQTTAEWEYSQRVSAETNARLSKMLDERRRH